VCAQSAYGARRQTKTQGDLQGLYSFLIAHLAAPVTGIPMDSGHVIEFVHGAPEWLKYTAKGIVALPFTFHSLNGIRHLAWDLVKGTFIILANLW
jgi:succinate dehydrogenase/fumarate reductase cytochrome b subunit